MQPWTEGLDLVRRSADRRWFLTGYVQRGFLLGFLTCFFCFPTLRFVPAVVCNAVMPLELGPLAACITVSATCLSATCMSANCRVNTLTAVGCGSSSVVCIGADLRFLSLQFNSTLSAISILPCRRVERKAEIRKVKRKISICATFSVFLKIEMKCKNAHT